MPLEVEARIISKESIDTEKYFGRELNFDRLNRLVRDVLPTKDRLIELRTEISRLEELLEEHKANPDAFIPVCSNGSLRWVYDETSEAKSYTLQGCFDGFENPGSLVVWFKTKFKKMLTDMNWDWRDAQCRICVTLYDDYQHWTWEYGLSYENTLEYFNSRKQWEWERSHK